MEKQARHVFVFALLSRIIILYSFQFFLNGGKAKVDIFLSTEDFASFKRNEHRKIRIFPIDCKRDGLELPHTWISISKFL